MKITVRVWGDYDEQSRTPLLAESEIHVENYGQARWMGETALQKYGGKNAHVDCDGPNQNFNSIWIAR